MLNSFETFPANGRLLEGLFSQVLPVVHVRIPTGTLRVRILRPTRTILSMGGAKKKGPSHVNVCCRHAGSQKSPILKTKYAVPFI